MTCTGLAQQPGSSILLMLMLMHAGAAFQPSRVQQDVQLQGSSDSKCHFQAAATSSRAASACGLVTARACRQQSFKQDL